MGLACLRFYLTAKQKNRPNTDKHKPPNTEITNNARQFIFQHKNDSQLMTFDTC